MQNGLSFDDVKAQYTQVHKYIVNSADEVPSVASTISSDSAASTDSKKVFFVEFKEQVPLAGLDHAVSQLVEAVSPSGASTVAVLAGRQGQATADVVQPRLRQEVKRINDVGYYI